jgi:predicted GIY-YIG superfamily endonuclease
MPNFEKNIIYKLCCDGQMYIGHTTDLYKRIHLHKSNIKKKLNNKLYTFIGNKSWYIEIIEKFPCENNKEAIEREQFWIEIIKPTLNSNRAFRTDEIQKKCDCEKAKRYYYKKKLEKINTKNI